MRFIWAFAIACVVAASSVCPEIETREQSRIAQLDRAPLAQQMLATRGVFARTHVVRLADFTLTAAVAFDVHLRVVVVRATPPHTAPLSATEVPHSARGPPVG